MFKYITIFKLTWIERMAYRVNFFMEVLSGIFTSLIVILLWMAIYRSSGQQIIGGYSLREMVTYILGGGLINSFILSTAENPETSQNIQDGTLSTFLIKPLNPYFVWFTRDLGTKAFYFFLGLIGYLVVALFFRDYLLGVISFRHLFLFILALILSSLLQFFLFEALSLLSFWVENTYGLRFTMRVIMEVVGGAIIPLSFFPEFLQKIFELLPFPFMIYLPMKIYLGKITLPEVWIEFLKEVAWVMVLSILNLIIWKKGIRQYVAMGD